MKSGINHKIMKFSVSENPIIEVSSSYVQKCGILYILPEERSRMRVNLIFFVVLECVKRARFNENEKF